MASSTLTSKGQITIPQAVRDNLGLQTGDKIDFVQDEKGHYQVVPRRIDVRVLRGRFAGRVKKPITVEQMAEAVEQEAVQRALRAQKQGSHRKAKRGR